MKVDIVTPTAESFVGDVSELIAPGVLGEFGVLSRHRDLCVALGTGVCRFRESDTSPWHYLLVDEGYLQITRGDRIIIVTEHAETRADVNAEQTKKDIEAARAELDASREHIGKSSWQVKRHTLALAEARQKLLELSN